MFSYFGKLIITSIKELGALTLLCVDFFRYFSSTIHLKSRIVDQFYHLGIKSVPMTVVASIFVGMAFTLQVTKEFIRFGAGELIGGIVAIAMWRELGPLMTGVVFSGRVAAAISAEIGSMKVTEQIDALEVLSQNPIQYLVIPRIVACTLALPVLVGLSDIFGFLSGFIIASGSDINPYAYFGSADSMLSVYDILCGLLKALVFGFVISVISCHMGLTASAGAKSVGKGTTKAVVLSLTSIFILNYFLSTLLF
jgi:phospholipid/cholesterol/gamma-HCH transport system permease protein